MAASLSIGSENATLSLLIGTTYTAVAGIQSYTEGDSPAPTRDGVTFGGVYRRTGFSRPSSITLDVQYLPHMPEWRALKTARDESTIQMLRLDTQEEIVLTPGNAGRAAVAMSGAVTFSGTGANNPTAATASQFLPGMVVQIGSVAHTIISVSDMGVITVEPVGSAVTAAAYDIRIPSLRRGPFAAKVASSDATSLASESDMTSSLQLEPLTALPNWTVQRVAPAPS